MGRPCTFSYMQDFNLYMDNIVREARQKFVGGVQMEETVVQLLLFADKLDACGRKR